MAKDPNVFNPPLSNPEPCAPDGRASSFRALQDDIDEQTWIGRSSRMRTGGGGNDLKDEG